MTRGEIAGIVLLASTTRFLTDGAPETVFAAGLDRVTVPTLILSHVADACRTNPPTDAPAIQAALTRAAKTEVIMVNGGTGPSDFNECKGGGSHSFAGMQPTVIERVAAWIKAQRAN